MKYPATLFKIALRRIHAEHKQLMARWRLALPIPYPVPFAATIIASTRSSPLHM